jgi:ribosome-associated protein YbcJ (S4-like RNA binding protein)
MQTNARQVKSILAFPVGSVLDVRGKVQKVVKRDGQCKLVIEPENAPEFVVFANCSADVETVRARKIRKGTSVLVRGQFASYGSKAVCLIDCRLMPEGNLEQLGTLKKENGKPDKT